MLKLRWLSFLMLLCGLLEVSRSRGDTVRTTTTSKPATLDCRQCNSSVVTNPVGNVLSDASLTSTSVRGCSFPTVEAPTPILVQLPRFCLWIARLRAMNSNYTRFLPSYCVCQSLTRQLMLSACAASIFDYFDQFYLLRRLYFLEQVSASPIAAEIAMKLRRMAAAAGYNVTMTFPSETRDNSKLRVCACLDRLIALARRLYQESERDRTKRASVMSAMQCEVDGSQLGLFGAIRLINLVLNNVNVTRIRQFCPQKGCCVARVVMTRNLTITTSTGRNGTLVDTRTFGGYAGNLIEPVCNRFISAVASTIRTCNAQQGFMLVSARSGFFTNDTTCAALKRALYTTAIQSIISRIRFTAAMCDEMNIMSRKCVSDFVPRAASTDYRNGNSGTREAVVTAANRLKGFSTNGTGTTRVRVTRSNETVGECLANAGGTLELDSNATDKGGRYDYIGSVGARSKIRSRLRRMIINQRCDLDEGELEVDSNTAMANGGLGEVDVDGVFTAQRGSKLRRVLLRLKNAGVIRDNLLVFRTRIQCESTLLLDGATVQGDGNATGSYEVDCSQTTAVLISGRGKRNVLRVRTRTASMEVGENSTVDCESMVNVTRIVLNDALSKIRVRMNSSAETEEVSGDGELEVDRNSELVIVRSLRAKLRLLAGAILKIRKSSGSNGTRNASAPAPVTTIDTPVDVPDDAQLAVEGRALYCSRNMTLRRLARLKFLIQNNDNLGGNGSAVIAVGGMLTAMFDSNDSAAIVIRIDAAVYCRLGKRIVLMSWTSGNPSLPTRVNVVIIGTASCMRRRLQQTTCQTVITNGQAVVDCSGSPASGGSSTTMAGSGPASSTTTAPGASTTTTANSGGASVMPALSVALFVGVFSVIFA